MKIKPPKRIIFLIIFILTTSSLLCSNFLDDRKEILVDQVIQRYSFNAAQALQMIDQGQKITLLPVDESSISSPTQDIQDIQHFLWDQNDYFRVARAVNQELWQIDLDKKNLINLAFEMDCKNVDNMVFSFAVFDSYQIQQIKNEKIRFEYGVGVFPTRNEVRTTKTEWSPSLGEYSPVDLEQYKFSAGDVIKIAEMNGGAEKRSDNKNECTISINAPGPNSDGWHIVYKNEENDSYLFEMKIDPQSGEFSILNP